MFPKTETNKSKKVMKEKTQWKLMEKKMKWTQGLIISTNNKLKNCVQKYEKIKIKSKNDELFFNKNIV